MRILSYATVLLLIRGSLILDAAGQNPPPSQTTVETIVFLRHGEKPPGGLGQLTCQGLNRALALPPVLISKFGKADFIFAPDPEGKVTEGGLRQFAYVRPLATIEPTAIRLGLPVRTDFRYKDIAGLQRELTKQQYRKALIFVAWEHYELDKMVRNLVGAFGGNPEDVPEWPGDDYDSLYVLRIRDTGAKKLISFSHEQEGLTQLSPNCP
ncbi:MAG: hypothetical protein JO232_16760 [Verrucomicrobia bacterium]|nr:hypothetical protein [Verrucomicrobiota bacterium]